MDVSEAGSYLVVWTVIASDTHPSRGSLTFSYQRSGPLPVAGALPAGDVGAVTPLGLLLQALGRWLHLAGFALAFGGIAAALFLRIQSERAATVGMAGLILLLVAEPVTLVAQVLSLGGLDGQVSADVLGSPSGRVLALRLAAALLLWSLLGAARQRRRAALRGVVALGIVLALVDATTSHTIPGVPPPLGIALNVIHELTMALWIGGLATLVAVLPELGPQERGSLITRFGRLAAPALGLVVLSGLLLALVHVPSPVALLSSAYGGIVAIKVAGVAVAVVAAYFGLRAGRSWREEAVAMAGVLALAALLVTLPPPR